MYKHSFHFQQDRHGLTDTVNLRRAMRDADRDPKTPQNLIDCSVARDTPLVKVSCKRVKEKSRYLDAHEIQYEKGWMVVKKCVIQLSLLPAFFVRLDNVCGEVFVCVIERSPCGNPIKNIIRRRHAKVVHANTLLYRKK